MRFGKKGGPLVTFPVGSWIHSEDSEARATSEARPVREKQYTLTAEFIDSYPDDGRWREMLSTDFEYVIAARVVDPSWTDPTRPPDGSRVVIIRGVLRDE